MALVIPDSRFEIPGLLAPDANTAGNLAVDFSHPIGSACIGFWNFTSNGAVNLIGADGYTDFTIDTGQLVLPASQVSTDYGLQHDEIDVTVTGGSVCMRLKIDSYSTYGVLSCLDAIPSSGTTRGFTVTMQGGTRGLMAWQRYGSADRYTGTKKFSTGDDIIGDGLFHTISASANPGDNTTNNNELLLDGVFATEVANDYWYVGVGVAGPNTYANLRGDWAGEMDYYIIFNRELSKDELLSMEDNPSQFLIPA